MNIDRLEALLWARIDGTIDPQELAELEALLAEQPEPRQFERQITWIADGLKELDTVQPPSELRGRINDALENATPPEAHRAASLLARPTPTVGEISIRRLLDLPAVESPLDLIEIHDVPQKREVC